MPKRALENLGHRVRRSAASADTLRGWYSQNCLWGKFTSDPLQERTLDHLQRLFDELVAYKSHRSQVLIKALDRKRPPRGLYLWGGVGRGKSFLMDAFFDRLPYRRKRRVHFHHFMQEVHGQLKSVKGQLDPLLFVAERMAVRYRVLCLDEFHVNDIVDAMILAKLLEGMFDHGMVLVTTSNYRPEDLYPNGLQREKFFPTIALINSHLDVIAVGGEDDYRLKKFDRVRAYYCPLDDAARQNLRLAFNHGGGPEFRNQSLLIQERKIPVLRRVPGIAWLDFRVICGDGRSQADYLDIAREFHTVLLDGVPRMTRAMASEARRFTWLVDIFYDHKVKLVCSAEAPPQELYPEGDNSAEFSRTVSRLIEMQGKQYLGQAHIS